MIAADDDVSNVEPTGKRTPWIIAIGASGDDGLKDIRQLLALLPGGLPAIVMVVLHRRWKSITHLREVLAAGLHPVVAATQGERFRPGNVYIGTPEDLSRCSPANSAA